jgi:hypothetical protein
MNNYKPKVKKNPPYKAWHILIDLEVGNEINIVRCERILQGEWDCSVSRIVNEILREHFEIKTEGK